MKDSINIYLQDHLAGSVQAIELVEHLRDRHSQKPLGQFASNLLTQITADREVLRNVAENLGTDSSTVKNLAAWFGEKLTRLKLDPEDKNGLGTFEALELLALGIHGKLMLWRSLTLIAPMDLRLRSFDFQQLAERAQAQLSDVEEYRLKAAQSALSPAPVEHH